MCGEKTGFGKSAFTKSGSPPHVRGKGERKTGKTRRVGITPACAGKRMHQWCRKIANWDHPRMCGEKSMKSTLRKVALGSPPRMRGKGYDVVSRLCRVRITPACAGKSTKSRNAIRSRWDHPRMCGEKNIWVADVTTSIGSPPHVRGKGVLPPMLWLWPGITPACAGKRTRNKAVGGAK